MTARSTYDAYATLLTIIDSAIKQSKHPFDALKNPDLLFHTAE
jgi:hypothetical protein